MMKIFLCGLIILAGFGAGWSAGRTLTNRRIHLRELITAISILEAEMKYRLDPLPELLLRVASLTEGDASACLKLAGDHLLSRRAESFYDCWRTAVEEIYENGSLRGEELRVLLEFGAELGKTDLANQQGLFERTLLQLEEARKEAVLEERNRGRMYKGLGTAVGFFLVIVLV